MSNLSKENIIKTLSQIEIPEINTDPISAGVISAVVVRDKKVGFIIETNKSINYENLIQQCKSQIKAKYPSIIDFNIVYTGREPPKLKKDKKILESVPGVKKIIQVAACKGGVGKSTITVILAKLLVSEGFKVGIVDADIYGPSIPLMMDIEGEPEVSGSKMLPMIKNNIKTISMGNIIPKDKAAIWRGPMITKSIYQLFMGVDWGELGYLLVDMPPGTGDVSITLADKFSTDGVVLVTTPQEAALAEVRKSVSMYKKLDIPILGIIENMSYYQDKDGKKHYIFGQDTTLGLCKELDLELLMQIPIDKNLTQYFDKSKIIF